jgi:dienelactone hydrolase
MFALVFAAWFSIPTQAQVLSHRIEYADGETTFAGYLAFSGDAKDKVPGVLVVPEWWGANDYAQRRAREVAGLGYVAFVADMYGAGRVTTNPKEAGKWATAVKGDRELMRRRASRALQALAESGKADPNRLAAIGYCFGGTTVLELARSNAPVKGVVSFHGGLGAEKAPTADKVKPKVLVLHGADDPMVPAAELAGFESEMKKAGADFQVVAYPGAVHSFTNPASGSDNSRGVAYNEKADLDSWAEMKRFLAGVLADDPKP